jgi:ectonucleotide pyrophosphatase/phosphodiesterase family member 4
VTERLKTSWKDRNLSVVILSDHGMTNLTSNALIALSDYIDLEQDVDYFSQLGVVASFSPKAGKLDYVYRKLKHHGHPNMTVYLKQDIPKRLHYQNNSRIMPITILADEGYVIDKVYTS